MNCWWESDLAWELADAIAGLIPDPDQTNVYATIGAGNPAAAINALVETIVSARLPVSAKLVSRLVGWLHAYAQTDDGPRLYGLLESIKTANDE